LEYVSLGASGLKVSRVCLGTMTYGRSSWRKWVLDDEESRPFVKRAFELGINYIDTANMYSMGASEEVLGRALNDFAPPRDQYVVSTKLYMPMGDDPNHWGLGRKHIKHAVEDSLRRLGLDYVDILIVHRFDEQTPVEETLRALDDLVREGKILYTGASSMMAWQFAKLLYTADQLNVARMILMQNHYNIVYREEEREMMPLCVDQGVAVTPYSPLARGFVAGNRRPEDFGDTHRAKVDEYSKGLYFKPEDFAVVDRVTEVAGKRGVSNARVALAWLLHQRGVASVVVGTTKMEQLDDLVEAVNLKLDDDELKSMEEPYEPHKVLVGRQK
jgi:aryl-alcohol dehydrogenase-like predicted oxidoreductase